MIKNLARSESSFEASGCILYNCIAMTKSSYLEI
jgi:hypothetical protein